MGIDPPSIAHIDMANAAGRHNETRKVSQKVRNAHWRGIHPSANKRKEISMFRERLDVLKTTTLLLAVMFLLTGGLIFVSPAKAYNADSDYSYWKTVGRKAAFKAVRMMKEKVSWLSAKDLIAMTNAGYAEVYGETTTGALDGLSGTLGVSRGDHSLVEIHSAAEKALWFAIYHQRSGYCVYLQVDPEALDSGFHWGRRGRQSLFSSAVLEQINAAHLFDNAAEYAEKFDSGIFGGNEFRIVTIANAVAEGAPTYAVHSFEFHDHYCPGVTSGILMALYIRDFLPLDDGGSYFVQTVQPWCKEDALLSMLNTTPGKKGYAVTYPTAEDIAAWPDWAGNASTIVYRKCPDTGNWDGMVLGYEGGDTGCLDYGHSVMNKLCSDLWYLERLDQPETFIKVLKEFELPEGVDPKSYARPGVDPMLLLDALD
jgi:formylmethanofuran dehydrogenase subunit E-like metal-binding protein